MFCGVFLPIILLLLCTNVLLFKNDEIVDLSGHGPDFIIIGSGSSGTSSLHYNLDQHNDIFSVKDPDNIVERNDAWLEQKYKGKPRAKLKQNGVTEVKGVRKEMHFFNEDERYSKGINHYKNVFKVARESITLELEREDSPFLLFEKTPKYFCDREVPSRIHQDFPNMKFLLMLRNPVDRMYSEMNRRYDKGHYTTGNVDDEECASWGDEEDLCLMRNFVERKIDDVLSSAKTRDDGCDYLSKGRYWEQLQRWFRYFDQDQFFIIKAEDYFTDSKGVFDDILRFFDVSLDYEMKEHKRKNKRDCLPMINEVRRKLMTYYEDSNQILYEMVGRDYEWEKLNEEKLLVHKNLEKVACDEKENCNLGSGGEEVIMNFVG